MNIQKNTSGLWISGWIRMCVIWFSYNPLSKDFLVEKEVSTYITRKFDCAPSVSFDVKSRGITIDAKPPKEIVTEDIVFSASTTPYTYVRLNVTWGLPSKVFFKNEIGDKVGCTILGEADKNGKLERKAYFEAIGSYEITAIEYEVNTSDSIFVEIAPYTVELKTDKTTYSIGEEVVITGSATAGDKLVLKIDDEVVKNSVGRGQEVDVGSRYDSLLFANTMKMLGTMDDKLKNHLIFRLCQA